MVGRIKAYINVEYRSQRSQSVLQRAAKMKRTLKFVLHQLQSTFCKAVGNVAAPWVTWLQPWVTYMAWLTGSNIHRTLFNLISTDPAQKNKQ